MREKQTVTKTLTVVFEVTLKDEKELQADYDAAIEIQNVGEMVSVWNGEIVEVRLK